MNCLIKLPKSFVELYGIVNDVKCREGRSDDNEDDNGFETAICLLTGAVMRSGLLRKAKKVSLHCLEACAIKYFSQELIWFDPLT